MRNLKFFLLTSTCAASLQFKAKLKKYKKSFLAAVKDKREKIMFHIVIAFVTTFKLSNGKLFCDIENLQPTDFGLSPDTITATKRDNSDVYQVKT